MAWFCNPYSDSSFKKHSPFKFFTMITSFNSEERKFASAGAGSKYFGSGPRQATITSAIDDDDDFDDEDEDEEEDDLDIDEVEVDEAEVDEAVTDDDIDLDDDDLDLDEDDDDEDEDDI